MKEDSWPEQMAGINFLRDLADVTDILSYKLSRNWAP